MISIIHITDWVHLNNHPIYQNGIKLLPFFLSWFFFKSGMLFKMPANYREYIKKCYISLLKPWVVWSVLSFVIWLIVLIINKGHIDFIHELFSYGFYSLIDGCHISNIPLWFFITLFLVKIIYPIISQLNINNIARFALFLMALQIIYYCKCEYGIFVKPLWLYNTIIGLFFFYVGDLLRHRQYSYNIVLGALLLYVSINIIDFSYVDIKNNITIFGNYLVFFISSICGIILINNLFLRITPPPKRFDDYSNSFTCR